MGKVKVGLVDMIPDGGKKPSSSPSAPDVMPHLKELKITSDMADGQRNFAEQYNAMRAVLIEHKLMKAK